MYVIDVGKLQNEVDGVDNLAYAETPASSAVAIDTSWPRKIRTSYVLKCSPFYKYAIATLEC